jgi:hypothetical protein
VPDRNGADKSVALPRCTATKRAATLSSPRPAQSLNRSNRLLRVQGKSMRTIVIALIVLSGLKVWTQDRMYRSVMGEALIEAYRDRAVEVCRKTAPKKALPVSPGIAGSWGTDADAKIVIGNPDLDVAIWDTENPLWGQRFQHPNVVLTEPGPAARHCAYDLRDGIATLATHQTQASMLPWP